MAAAHSLRELKDDKTAYAIYYDLLTGERKIRGWIGCEANGHAEESEGAGEDRILRGSGIYPVCRAFGWDAYRTMHKKDPNPVRAVAATSWRTILIRRRPKALVKATER